MSSPVGNIPSEELLDRGRTGITTGWQKFFSDSSSYLQALTLSGTTAQRPTKRLYPGRPYFDTSLGTNGKPIWAFKNGTGWIDISDLANATGDLGVSHLNGGTNASATTYWRGDGAWINPFATATFESSEQTLTAATDTSVAHGLGRVPKLVRGTIRCKTADLGYAVGDEVPMEAPSFDIADRGISVYANSISVGFVVAATSISIMSRTGGTIGRVNPITLANWKMVLRAW